MIGRRGWLPSLLVAATLVLSAVPASADDDLDAWIQSVMADWQVPGLAVGAIRDGTVVLARTYGTVDAEGSAPITTNTAFAIGSVTKTMTATALAMMVAEGTLEWDSPVYVKLPWFRVANSKVAERISVRHLVSHRSGMPNGNVLWYVDVFDRAEVGRRLAHVRPLAPPGTSVQYSNVMVSIAGAVAERIDGATWADVVRRRVLVPAGMTATHLSLAAFRNVADRARPYFLGDDGSVSVPHRDPAPVAPAGSTYSTIDDMLRYLGFHLRGPWLNALAGQPPPATDGSSLGPSTPALGVFVASYRGHRMVFHGGAIDGYRARLAVLPDDGIGVVVLTNLSGRNRAPRVIVRGILDRLLGLEPLPWNARLVAAREAAIAESRRATTEVPEESSPDRNAAAYAGRYEHPAYGVVDVAPGSVRLQARFNGKPFVLIPIGGDTWRADDATWPVRQGVQFTFHADGSGAIDRLESAIADAPSDRLKAGPVTFRRID